LVLFPLFYLVKSSPERGALLHLTIKCSSSEDSLYRAHS
jgi:hypothetical protein